MHKEDEGHVSAARLGSSRLWALGRSMGGVQVCVCRTCVRAVLLNLRLSAQASVVAAVRQFRAALRRGRGGRILPFALGLALVGLSLAHGAELSRETRRRGQALHQRLSSGFRVRLVAFGDSLTAGWGTDGRHVFPVTVPEVFSLFPQTMRNAIRRPASIAMRRNRRLFSC